MNDFRGRANERRQLTVLFCDIVDSTGLSERCDAEDLSEILQEFQRISTRCINEAGGTVINYIGDGIRSEFGYPLASENEAASAVRAGLALLKAIDELGARAHATIQEPLLVRIGVHTGVAVIGKAASGHVHDATEIVGDTPNIAFRLQEIGSANSLVISGETQRLLKRKFQLRPLGLHALKGLSRKVEAFQVLGEATDDHTAYQEYLRDASPLVGRCCEIGQLLEAWNLAKTGRGHTVEITGEAGIGKSRLAMELVGKVERDDGSIVVLQASAEHQHTPFYPIIRRLEQMIGVRKEESDETNAARLCSFLAAIPGCDEEQHGLVSQLLGLPPPRPMAAIVPDTLELRRRTREVLVQLLMSHCPGDARLILVEDLHWADPSTAEVIDRIGALIANAPILLVRTSRTASMRSTAATLRRLPLQRLADDDCRILAGSVVLKQLSKKLLEQIVARSDGVPLFVEELTAAAVETGQVDPGVGSNVVAGGHGVPSALYDPLMLRLERLGTAKAIAQVASVIGRSFSHHLLGHVATERGDAFEAALERLLQSGLIRLEPNDDEKVYSFKHALVRDVAYHSLLKRQRRELHARVADSIELYLPEIADREPDYLAQHLSEAERTSRAVNMWLKAANTSAQRSANLETLAQLEMALDQIKRLPAGFERDNLELNAQIARIGPTIALQGFAAQAVADVSSRAIELCHALDDDPRVFPALYARWSYLRGAGNVREAGVLAQDYLTLAEKKGARADRMVGHRLLGTSLLDAETERARQHLEKAIQLYDAHADRVTAVIYGTDVHVGSLSNLCTVDWLLGRIDEALKHGRGALDSAARLQHAHTLGYAVAHVCMLYTLERDVDAVEALAQHALAGATKRELPLWIAVARTFLGWCQLQSGRVAEGIDTLEKQRNFLETAHLSYWLPTYLCWLAEAYTATHAVNEARLCLEQARTVFGHGGHHWYEAEYLRIEGCFMAHPEIGDAAQSERCFTQALALARQRGHRGFALRAVHSLAAHLVGSGRSEEARTLLRAELATFADAPDGGDRASARAFLSSLESVCRN